MQDLIIRNCERDSIIHTDGFKSYIGLNRIRNYAFVHRRHVHATGRNVHRIQRGNFNLRLVRPPNHRGTNQIESYWGQLKRILFAIYTGYGNENNTEELVLEAAWRLRYRNKDL